ncbi:MAG: hemolysin family protein [Opitutaceae bacterium]
MSEAWFSFFISFGAVVTILVLHAYLVMCEISLMKLRYGNIDDGAVAALKERDALARLIERGDQTGRVVRFSKTLCSVAVGLLLMPLVSDFFGLFNLESKPDRWVVVLLAFSTAVSVHFFFAEIFPRGLAMRDPVGGLIRSYRVLFIFKLVTFPVMFALRGLKKILFKKLGVDVDDEFNPLDVDVQIRAMGEDSNSFSPVIRRIVTRTLQVQDLVVHDVLLPRSQVIFYDVEQDLQANMEIMKAAGHTRFPICRGGLDDCLGIIHIKDIFRFPDSVDQLDAMKLKRSLALFPLETPLEEALERMLRAKFHMALAVDEFGGVVGVVTLESILEELVGEIQDEFDSEEEEIIELQNPLRYRVSGLALIHDVEERLDVEITDKEVSTFGGLITGELGHIPKPGETLSFYNLDVTVDEVDDRRVISTTVLKAHASEL